MKDDQLIMYCAGDVGPNRDDPDTMFTGVTTTLAGGDINFCQLEINISDRGTPLPQARLPMRADPDSARAIRDAGFHVVSFASNHCMDWGREAFADTLGSLREQSIKVIGAGENIREARKPALYNLKGSRIAFLAYNSVLPMAYWAEEARPGCAPLRAYTVYEQIEHDQPGTPCRIHTFTDKSDLSAMIADIQRARSEADIVIVSAHWGVHFIPAVIADYQKEIAHTAIDAGADLILGHHPHILKGIEVYKGKVVFYSLSNFALELPFQFDKNLRGTTRHNEIERLNPDWDSNSEYPMPPDTRKTMLVKVVVSSKQIQTVSFLPVFLNTHAEPEIIRNGDSRFDDIVKYVFKITEDQGFPTPFIPNGDEYIIPIGRE